MITPFYCGRHFGLGNSILRNDGEIGGMRGIGGKGGIKFDLVLKLNCWFYIEFRSLI